MGSLQFQKRKKVGRSSAVNLSKSGASILHRTGPVTVNSRGSASVRILPGFSYRMRGKSGGGAIFGIVFFAVYALFWACWAALRVTWWLLVLLPIQAISRVRDAKSRQGLPPVP